MEIEEKKKRGRPKKIVQTNENEEIIEKPKKTRSKKKTEIIEEVDEKVDQKKEVNKEIDF